MAKYYVYNSIYYKAKNLHNIATIDTISSSKFRYGVSPCLHSLGPVCTHLGLRDHKASRKRATVTHFFCDPDTPEASVTQTPKKPL